MTIISNASDKILKMGDLYYCTDTVDFANDITELTSSNQATVLAELAALTWVTVGHIKNFNISHSLENEEIVRAGNCGVGEIARYHNKTPTITATWLDVNNRPVFDAMMGLDRISVAASLVSGAEQVIASPFVAEKFYAIANQNGDGSKPTVNSVTGSTDGALTEGADYDVLKSGNDWGIMLYTVADGTNISTLTQTITIDYDYTPSAHTIDGYNIKKAITPQGLYKFVSCTNEISATQGVKDTVYFWKYVLTGQLVEAYIDREETEFAGAEVSFVGVTGGGYLKQKATVSL